MPNLNVIKEGPGGFNEYIDDRAEAVVNAAIGVSVQAFDADTTAIASLTGTGFAQRTGTNTWALNSNVVQTNVAPTFTEAVTIQDPLNIQSATLTGSQWFSVYATNGTSAGDFLAVESANTGAQWRFRRDGGLSSSFVVLGNGPRIDANAGLSAVRVRDGAGGSFANLEVAAITMSGLLFLGSYTVGTLPAASANSGALATVTNATSATNGTTVSGGGSIVTLVQSNGTNWIVK